MFNRVIQIFFILLDDLDSGSMNTPLGNDRYFLRTGYIMLSIQAMSVHRLIEAPHDGMNYGRLFPLSLTLLLCMYYMTRICHMI
jgi:hypothetical protein